MATWSNEITSERNELVFESRNQSYGAYQIRRQYGKVVLIAGGLATTAILFFVFIYIVVNRPVPVVAPKKLASQEVVLKDPPPVDETAPPPPPPPPPPTPQVKMIVFTEPEVVDEAPPAASQDKLPDIKIGDDNTDGADDAAPDVITPTVDHSLDTKPEEVFTFAEVMPDFPGAGFQAYLKNNIKYPVIEKEAGKQGTVYISFVVEKDGSITNVAPAKEVTGAPGLTKEAMRVISQMPKWTPGLMNGHPVRIEMKQPVRFVLQ